MIPAGVQVFVALEPVDMRFGFERLGGMVRERMGYDPASDNGVKIFGHDGMNEHAASAGFFVEAAWINCHKCGMCFAVTSASSGHDQ